MKTNKKLFVLAIIVGFFTVIILNYYLSEAYTEVLPAATVEQTGVVVAQVTIPQHTRITADMLTVERIYTEAVHPEAVRDLNEIVGGVSRSDIVRGEQVLANRVATETMRATLSYRIPENYRAIAIPVGDVSGVAGYISPGDRVDVLAGFSLFKHAEDEVDGEAVAGQEADIPTVYTVLQNVLVLATDELTHELDDEARHVVGTITLLATPEQAEVLAYATREGALHLALRSPLDEEFVELDYFNEKNFETFRER